MGSGMAGIEGAWTGQDVKVEIKSEGPNTWKLSAKVANNMGCTITKDGETFKASPVMCTRMMPPPDLQEKENTLSKILSELTGINVKDLSYVCLVDLVPCSWIQPDPPRIQPRRPRDWKCFYILKSQKQTWSNKLSQSRQK